MGGDKLAEATRRIAELEAQLKAAEEAKNATVSFKVTESGGVSVYGCGQFPVTLYKKQWRKLLGSATELGKFIDAQDAAGKLSDGKNDPKFAAGREAAKAKRAAYAAKHPEKARGF